MPAILMVDDDPSILMVGKLMLKKAGHRVLTAGSGTEALAMLQANDVSLVFLDLIMPGQDGVQTFRALREAKPEIAVVIVSGHDDARSSGEFSTLGDQPVGYLQKPFTLLSLTAAAQKYFKPG
ncbi:MAG: response regulator [Planctomycetes bacterium]|nr:response regulator [Planctomycetota bacterium]